MWWGKAEQKREPTKDPDSGSCPINAGISRPRLSLLNRFCREKNIRGWLEMKNKQSKTNTHLSKTSLLSRRGWCLCLRIRQFQLQREGGEGARDISLPQTLQDKEEEEKGFWRRLKRGPQAEGSSLFGYQYTCCTRYTKLFYG